MTRLALLSALIAIALVVKALELTAPTAGALT